MAMILDWEGWEMEEEGRQAKRALFLLTEEKGV